MIKDIGYCISVDTAPDRRDEEVEERMAQAIEDGEAKKCELCGEIMWQGDKGFYAALCSDCAVQVASDVTLILRRLADTLSEGKALRIASKKSTSSRYLAACFDCVADFLTEDFCVDGSIPPKDYQGATISIRDLLLDYLQEEN